MNYIVDKESGILKAENLCFNSKCVEVPREDKFRGLYSHILIKIDLENAITYLERAIVEDDYSIKDGLFRIAVISYAKCFSASKRGGRSPLNAEKIYKGNKEDIYHHKCFVEMRNKYFAHDEKDFKDAMVGLLLNVDSREYVEIIDVALRGEFAFEATLKILRVLCEKNLDEVEIMIKNDKESLRAYFDEKNFCDLEKYPEINLKMEPVKMDISSD